MATTTPAAVDHLSKLLHMPGIPCSVDYMVPQPRTWDPYDRIPVNGVRALRTARAFSACLESPTNLSNWLVIVAVFFMNLVAYPGGPTGGHHPTEFNRAAVNRGDAHLLLRTAVDAACSAVYLASKADEHGAGSDTHHMLFYRGDPKATSSKFARLSGRTDSDYVCGFSHPPTPQFLALLRSYLPKKLHKDPTGKTAIHALSFGQVIAILGAVYPAFTATTGPTPETTDFANNGGAGLQIMVFSNQGTGDSQVVFGAFAHPQPDPTNACQGLGKGCDALITTSRSLRNAEVALFVAKSDDGYGAATAAHGPTSFVRNPYISLTGGTRAPCRPIFEAGRWALMAMQWERTPLWIIHSPGRAPSADRGLGTADAPIELD